MSERPSESGHLVQLSDRLTTSPAFGNMFREGMDLVEETAAYLDGQGRTDAKTLERGAALTYATESMRLTTRLMQLASWLLLHRAVKEGEMSLHQANADKTRVKLNGPEPGSPETLAALPEKLQSLISRAADLHSRVRRFDATIHALPPEQRPQIGNPLVPQLNALKAAFER